MQNGVANQHGMVIFLSGYCNFQRVCSIEFTIKKCYTDSVYAKHAHVTETGFAFFQQRLLRLIGFCYDTFTERPSAIAGPFCAIKEGYDVYISHRCIDRNENPGFSG